jgi:hypothetical protein
MNENEPVSLSVVPFGQAGVLSLSTFPVTRVISSPSVQVVDGRLVAVRVPITGS